MVIVVKNACKRRKGYYYYIDPKGNLVEQRSKTEKNIETKEKEDAEKNLKFIKDDLKHKKQVYETYIKALIKYNIKELAYQSIMYDELNQNLLMRKLESCRDDGKKFAKLFFGDGKKLSEEENIRSNIEYYDKLIRRCRGIVSGAQDKVKEKIAKDAVEKSLSWLTTPELVEELVKLKPMQSNNETNM